MISTTSTAEKVAQDVLRTIGVLFVAGEVIEIRALAVGKKPTYPGSTYSGYFNFENCDAITRAIKQLDGHAEGVYVILNRFHPELLARANNRLQAKPKNTTTDADIIAWRWLYIDADPARPAGISATEIEHQAALDRAAEIRDFLTGRGWPEPVVCDSGNGGHLLYLLPILELKHASDLVKRCLKVLANRFSDAIVTIDEATANPARLCKLYGTLARKGDAMSDRPHRRSKILDEPEHLDAVPVEALEALAAQVLIAPPRAGAQQHMNTPATSRFNTDEWIAGSGLEIIKGPEPYDGGRRWTVKACPFNAEHEKPVILELSNGALVYKCLHKSCTDNDWKALRRLVEPNYGDSVHRRAHANASMAAGAQTQQAGRSMEDAPLITDLAQIPSVFSLHAELNWCVERMVAEGSITLICAESGTGKTWIGYYNAGCVAHGTAVIGLPVRSRKVLYLDGENPLCVVKQRLFDLGISETPNLTVWGGWNDSPPVGPHNPLVIEFARRHKGLIIYDSLIEFHPGSEQSSTETREFMRHFRTLANLGAVVIVLHHTGKAETSKLYRGSSDIKAAVDTAYVLLRNSQQPEELAELSMNCFKARMAPGMNFGMVFKKRHGFTPSEAFKPTRTVEEIITEILEASPNRNQTEIVRLAQAQDCSKRQIESCLRNGKWCKTPGPKNSTLYSLPGDRIGDNEALS